MNVICNNMDILRDYHTKRSKSNRKTNMISHMWNLIKMIPKKPIYKTETHRFQNQTYGYQRENRGRDNL